LCEPIHQQEEQVEICQVAIRKISKKKQLKNNKRKITEAMHQEFRLVQAVAAAVLKIQ
jgi:hypothetical protein